MNLRIITPEPRRQNRYGRHICPTRVRFDTDRWPTYECGRKFWLRSSYDAHWIQEHRLKPMPTVAPGPAPGSLSLEEEGRRLASRRDDLIALGVPSELLAVPHAPRHRSPFNVKDAIVIQHGPDWAPQAINVNGVNYWRAGWEPGKDI